MFLDRSLTEELIGMNLTFLGTELCNKKNLKNNAKEGDKFKDQIVDLLYI